MTELLVDFCDYRAARFAVVNWHYSKAMPTPPAVYCGVWEKSTFVGVVIFSRGANRHILAPYGLGITQGAELSRIALTHHTVPVSKIVVLALKLLKQNQSDLRLIISYADPNQEHIGTIYQAGNWIYSGVTSDSLIYIDRFGRQWHPRQVSKNGVKRQYGQLRRVPKIDDCRTVRVLGKHRYLYPLDRAMRRQIEPLAQPYPKREIMRAADGSA